jgi:F-type H+-transporting ATPase subunit epsilon
MDKTLSFSVVTPEEKVHEMQAESVTLTTSTGEITILPGHVPLVSELKPGFVTVRNADEEELIAISTGFVEVRTNNEVVVLADTADRADALDEEAIKNAKSEAIRIMNEEKNVDEESFARAAAALERELARERVVRKKKYRDVGKR